MLLSIVAPVFQNEERIEEFSTSLIAVCEQLAVEYEVILVNDGSSDNSWGKMRELATRLPNLRAVNLSRNFGQHKAVMAGLSRVRGQWIVILDSDLEEDPRHIPSLLALSTSTGLPVQIIRSGMVERSWYYRMLRELFYRMLNKLSDISYNPNVSNYGCYPRELIEQVKASRTAYPFIPSLIKRFGRKIEFIEVDQSSSSRSQTTYTPKKLLAHAFNIVINNSKKPLFFLAWLGFVSSILSLSFSGYVILEFFIHGNSITGWTSLVIVSSLGFSLTILSIGILSVYLSTLLELSLNSNSELIIEEFNSEILKKKRVRGDK